MLQEKVHKVQLQKIITKNEREKHIVDFRFLKTGLQHTKIYKKKFTWRVGGGFGGLGRGGLGAKKLEPAEEKNEE